MSSPLENLDRHGEKQDAVVLLRFAQEYRVVGLVVGLPMHLSGHEGEKAREARTFGAWLGKITGLPVTYFDERYSSSLAMDLLVEGQFTKKKTKAQLDKIAAHIILQNYLDSLRPQTFDRTESMVEP